MNSRKMIAGLVASLAMLASVLFPSAPAHAQPALNSSQISDHIQLPDFNQLVRDFDQRNRDGAWHLRNQLVGQARQLNPQFASGLAQTIDQALNFVFPGLIAEKEQAARAARGPAEPMTPAPARGPHIDTAACPADARVCVDIDGRRTWLQDGRGNVTHVASAMAPGKPGQDTPRGTFHVNRKVKDEISWEFGNAPMPYAIYFTNNGHAFHQGSPAYDSAGCVRLPQQDALTYWNHLNIGDKVFIY